MKHLTFVNKIDQQNGHYLFSKIKLFHDYIKNLKLLGK